MKKVLIITHSKDNSCIEVLEEALKNHGAQLVRFDTDRYPKYSSITTVFDGTDFKSFLVIDGERHALKDFVAIFNRRRYNLASCLTDELEKAFLTPTIGECRATLNGFVEGLPLFKLNEYFDNRKSELKETELKVAHQVGLKIPKTCITNNEEEAKQFIKDCGGEAIVKMQSSFAMHDQEGNEHVVFTNKITLEDFDDELGSLQYCPMQFQELIDKKVELRITIVGTKCFAMALDSQSKERGKVDWRKVGAETIEDWVPYEISAELEHKLLAYQKHYGLNYGAADVIVTPDDEYVFLETNPGGEYFWIDILKKGEISEQLAQVLLGIAPRIESYKSEAVLV